MSQASAPASRLLFSAVGVVAVLAIVVAVNLIARAVPLAADLTEDNVHTLSEGTQRILDKIDTPVSVKLYVTQDSDVMPPQLQTRAREVEAFLLEYARASDGMVSIEKYDPQPDTDEEDAARLAGIEANPTGRGDVYFGASVTSLDQKVTLPFIPMVPEELLEYEVTRAISQVSSPEKVVVGLISSHNVAGGFGGGNPFGGGRPEPAWIFFNELQRDFEVRVLGQDIEAIEDDIKVLVLLHPAELADSALYAIDQFLLRGGRLAVFLDALSITARMTQPQQPNPMMQQPPGQVPTSSNLEKLLSTWGYRFNSTEVVADLTYKTPLRGGRQAPAVLTLPPEAINQDDVLTSRLNDVWLVFSGAFSGEPVPGLQKEILLTSSPVSQMVDPSVAENNDEQVVDEFEPSGEEKILALRLTGTFDTAFPDGKPAAEEEEGADGDDADGAEGEEGAAGDDADGSLKKSAEEGVVVLVADSDLLYDQFSVQVSNIFGQRLASPINGNLALFQNIMEQLSGDTDLIAIRSRASTRRPFTRVNEIEENALAKIRDELQKLDEQRQEAETKINQLQAEKDDSQKFILTPEQQKEIQKFEQARVDAAKSRRELQKEARAEVNSLLARIKAINIFGIPLLVAVVGITVSLVRRAKTSAR